MIDRHGKPVAGATVAAESWRGHRTLNLVRFDTDQEGRFEWRNAPDDSILFSAFKVGYMSSRRVEMTAAGSDSVVTLNPVLLISGRVKDAETGKPLPTFRLIRGLAFSNNPRVAWMTREASEFSGGRYTFRQDEPYDGYAIRIEADGYKPAESRVFRPGEESPTFDFAMTRALAADLLSGIIVRPDGKPAAGAEVALATPEHPLIFEAGRRAFGRGNGMSIAKTGPDGRFSFDRPTGAFLIAAMSDDGYSEATPEAFAKSDALTLRPWGKIKGRARIGRKPAANEVIALDRRGVMPRGPRGVHGFYQMETRANAQGEFIFDRVIPGPNEVSRVIITEFGNGSSQYMGCWQEPVDVAPGQTVLVHIGARGRPVIGRIVLHDAPGGHVNWRQNRPATLTKARGFNLLPDPRRFDRYAANLDKDGRFRIDDVPPGRYELTVTIDAPAAAERPGPVQELGVVKVPVEVLKGDDDVPVDLGEIAAEVKGR